MQRIRLQKGRFKANPEGTEACGNRRLTPGALQVFSDKMHGYVQVSSCSGGEFTFLQKN